MTTALGNTLNLSYDALRRLSSVSVGNLTREYLYRNLSDTQTTTQVATVRYPITGTSLYYNFNYTYDALGNISGYTLPDGTAINLTYDDQGQLLTVTGDSFRYGYTYDAVGNLLSAAENGENHTYTYGDADWKDLLTAYDGQSITYDGSGNPTSYYNGTRWTMGWSNGRSLTSAANGSTSISFTYDAGGMRTSKTVGNITSIYAYASGKLLREIRYNSADQTTDVLDFFYAYDGTPYAMKYNGTVYYFLTNLQGDVVMILDANGSLAGGYVYDPYGKVLTATGAIAQINPIRYRGYYHDTETGFYYLHSRYYDPEIGRFINADGYASTGQGVIGHNMFAYCNNNPVNYIDVSGNFAIPATVVAAAGSALGGAVGGALVSSVSYAVGQGMKGEPIDSGDLIENTVRGSVIGAVGGAAGALKVLGIKALLSVGTGIYAGTSAYSDGKDIGDSVVIGVATTASTLVGATGINANTPNAVANIFTNYAATLFVGTPFEMISQGVQSRIPESQNQNIDISAQRRTQQMTLKEKQHHGLTVDTKTQSRDRQMALKEKLFH